MLMAAGLPLYKHLNVHGFWTVEGQKMSKSLANTVAPLEVKAEIGMDAFRYFLLRESVFGQDPDFRHDSLITRYNTDLANNLGNFVSRALAMQQKYFAGAVQPLPDEWPAEDCELRDKFVQTEKDIDGYMRDLQFHRALESVMGALDHANRYIVQMAPFTMIKDPAKQARVGAVLHQLLEVVRTLARLLAPFLPDTVRELRALLALDDAAVSAPWGRGFSPGQKINSPKVLFPRIDLAAKK
jgi:methionyl-tRNA synthetase